MIDRVLSHYKLVEKIGAGGMGEVYRATDTTLPRDVALKVLPQELAQDPNRRARFEREASTVASLKHPNIVTIHSIEEDEGVRFITMELVEGKTLSEHIPKDGLPLESILKIAGPLTDALSSAHAKGIAHRDLKPANIMLDAEGRVKVLDFGLAKLIEAKGDDDKTISRDGATEAGQVLGTVAYMSPEQAQGQNVDFRSDIFSIGIVLYQMATGKHPFEGPTSVSTLSAILKDTPRSITDIKKSLPPVLAGIVNRCLEKSPDHRYQSTSDLRDKLRELTATHASGQVAAAKPETFRRILIRPQVLLSAAALVLALVVGAAVWYQRAAKVRWARQVAIPEVERMLDAAPSWSGPGIWNAFRLAREAERHVPDDPLLDRLRPRYSAALTIHTDPTGALVYARPYASLEEEWEFLGETPIDELSFAKGVLHVRVEKEGYEPIDDLYWNDFFSSDVAGYALRETGSALDGMVWASEAGPQLYIEGAPAGIHLPGIEHLPRQELGDFYVDRYEVTNEEYKRFLDGGGYNDPEYWKEPFFENGRTLSFEEAVTRFTDETGRPGPATWEVGDYSDGQDDFPVTGVSWYEAAAYAAFVGKSLPTIYHWDRVALTWASQDIVPYSNLTSDGLMPVGSSNAANRYGTYDLGGNVREWCANEDSRGGRFILGGGWNDPAYGFNDAFAQSPWDRSESNGFRCIKYSEESVRRDELAAVIDLPFRDFHSEPQVSDETFALFINQYSYDKTPLNEVVEETRDEEEYTREKIVFDAAYGDERMGAYLFVPTHGRPPYQTVILFPGSGAIHTRTSEFIAPGPALPVVKSGRAVLRPVYKSTFERGDGLASDYPDETNDWKDHVIMWGKDLRRSIDYLETRADIDTDKLAYMGVSWGAAMAPIMMAVEPRFKAGIVVVAGLNFQHALPEVDELHYIRRVRIPVMMLNGKYDFFFPYETAQKPYYELLGTAEEHKKLVVHESGHTFPRTELARETLAWLDEHLAPVP